ncbi:hypothetical protein MMC28_006442 [Mycoblastus sanguinarius]|nr:hypothetical protein [Mycoblastus sanguinarius]
MSTLQQLVQFLSAIQDAGIDMDIQPMDGSVWSRIDLNMHTDSVDRKPRQAWYESNAYRQCLKSNSWWPSKYDYNEWRYQKTEISIGSSVRFVSSSANDLSINNIPQ